jgi:hypothetical protein
MRGLASGLLGLGLLAAAGCGVHAEREDPDLFRRKIGEYAGTTSAVSLSSHTVPRPFDAVMNDVKPTAERCLTQNHPGNYALKISASSETAVVTIKDQGTAVLEYRAEGLLFLLADFKADGKATKITFSRSFGHSHVESDIKLWASGQSRDCQFHMKLPLTD